jgi:uncharacterized protein YozE (UPF0346 family)
LVGNEHEVLGEYINSYTKILMRHNICNHEYKIRPDNFLIRKRCPLCYGKFQKTHEQFCEEIFNITNNEYEILGQYINAKIKVKIKHKTCGDVWECLPGNILGGSRCPKCAIERLIEINTVTHQEFTKRIYDLVGDEYTILSQYIGIHLKVLLQHNLCGYKWKVIPSSFYRGARCPKCAGNAPLNDELFREEIFLLYGEDYKVLGHYINANSPILMRHIVCGKEWNVRPCSLLYQFTQCPECQTTSKGEEKIRQYLKHKNINFKEQYKFNNCRDKRSLPFDFAIFNKNNELQYLIEYDGEQHYKSIEMYGGYNTFIQLQIHDNIKTNYCLQNNISLIRIPYWDFKNIENILDIILDKLNIIGGEKNVV